MQARSITETIKEISQKEASKQKAPITDKIRILVDESSVPVTTMQELSF